MDIGDPDRPELEARPDPRIMFGLRFMEPGGQRMGRGAVAAAMPCAGERRCRMGRRQACHGFSCGTNGCKSAICPLASANDRRVAPEEIGRASCRERVCQYV